VLVEALLLFETVQIENRSILDFLAADYTWVDPRLARLYGFDLDQQLDPQEAAAAVGNRELPSADRIDSRRNGPPHDARPTLPTGVNLDAPRIDLPSDRERPRLMAGANRPAALKKVQ
jgi:hypothetical protein